MARVKGPLFSVGASGTVGGILTFNPGKKTTTARHTPARYPPPTMPQQATRQKCADAAASWRSLDQTERAEWTTIASNGGRLPFAKYLLEWMAQNSTPAQPPFIPME